MTRDDFRRRADLVREIPLEVVLTSWGAARDRHDKSQWRTPRGPLSVAGAKFFNWHLFISTAGVRSGAPWLCHLLARGYRIYCGFDTDEAGETASRQMMGRHPSIQRLRPPGHDWNDVLTATSK